jgi:hypothetical protein
LPSYHDLFVTTAGIPRSRLFDLPYGLEVRLQLHCNRVSGWQLWDVSGGYEAARLIAGEYDGPDRWLVLDVDGHVIVDSRREEEDSSDDRQ